MLLVVSSRSPDVVDWLRDHHPCSPETQFLFRHPPGLVTPAARQSVTGYRSIEPCPSGAGHLTKILASYTVTIVTLSTVCRLWHYGLKNSSMSGALAAPPGNAVTPSPFSMRRSVPALWISGSMLFLSQVSAVPSEQSCASLQRLGTIFEK